MKKIELERANAGNMLRARLAAAADKRQLSNGVVDVGGFHLPLLCPLCSRKIIPPAGSLFAPVVIVSEFPGYDELRSGKPMSGHAGRVLRAELERAGLRFDDCRVTNLWLHAKSDKARGKEGALAWQKEYEWHLARLLEELSHHTLALILGSDVSTALLKLPVMDVAGVPFTGPALKKTLLPANIKLALAAPSPAIVYQRGQTSGEFSLALDRFAKIVKEKRK